MRPSRIHVYRLKNAQALDMVEVLNNLLSGGGSPSTLSPTTGKGSLGRGSILGTFNGMGGGMSGAAGAWQRNGWAGRRNDELVVRRRWLWRWRVWAAEWAREWALVGMMAAAAAKADSAPAARA